MNFDEINNCKYAPTGINAQFGYNTQNITNNNEDTNNETREKLLSEIRYLKFAVTDIAEYLNTHPNDEKAICLHKEYCNQLKNLTDKYQRVYGPLSIYCPCNSWRWLENPWPWERSED